MMSQHCTTNANRKSALTIVLAAGGTGGHVFPAVALADALIPMGYDCVFVTDKRGDNTNFDFNGAVYTLSAGSPSGKNPVKIAVSLGQLLWGYVQARHLYKTLKPAVVVGFGGYPSVPALLAAQHTGIKTVVHDQNAVFGRANRLLAKGANVLATSFPEIQNLLRGQQQKMHHTGNPVRPAIAQLHGVTKPDLVPSGAITLLITGGSLGAHIFGDIVPQAVALLDGDLKKRLRIIQQVRKSQVASVQKHYDTLGVNAHVTCFITDMPKHLHQAHLAICRAGGSTVAEMTCAGVPALYIPLPSAADNHQTHNTDHVVQQGGGWIMPQATFNPSQLAGMLSNLLQDPVTLSIASDKAKQCSVPHAHKKLAMAVHNLVL